MAGDSAFKPLERAANGAGDEVDQDVNKNVDPTSRRFVKGVPHSSPDLVSLGAAAYLFLLAAVVINLVMIVYVISSLMSGSGVSKILLGVGWGLFILSFFSYLAWGAKSSCMVCGQRQFIPKSCIKHKKAHRIPVLGYMLPTALQMLLFHWFYCIFCGTAVRLKK